MRNALMAMALAALLSGCGGGADDDAGGADAFELDLAVELGQLCLQSYQMLTDFEDGATFTLPAPYTLQAQYLTPEHYPGESFSSEVPIAFVATSGSAIYVVFRGTKTISEWISDATFTQVPYPAVSDGGKTETGFTAIYQTIDTAIVDEVNHLAASSAYTTLYVTGHSLGAALATLAAPELARATRFTAPVLYNFASPRTGDPTFAALADELPSTWRVVNTNDEVPKLPPAVAVVVENDQPHFFFYEHIESEYPITFGVPIHDLEDLEEDHAMCNYYSTLCERTTSPATCKQMAGGADGCNPR